MNTLEIYYYIFKEIENSDMTDRSAQQYCRIGRLFHASCVGIGNVKEYENEDWRCGDADCRKYTMFCCRDNTEYSRMVACSSTISVFVDIGSMNVA